PIADPYSLTETRFMEGYAETFAGNAENAEMANYAEFHTMKLALRDNDGAAVGANIYSPLQPDGHINWYALTPAQIAQLQTIAERNTGRASVMAKGVLCFFFGICYDDPVETQDFASLQQGDDGNDTATTHAKRATTDIAGDAALTVYPNPTDDLLYIELSGAGIANIALYDLQGRAVYSQNSSNSPTATLNMHNIPAGVYVLHVTDKDGREYQQKVVRR
ncbi:MAG: T9SS type A sorting domain-containing protein, partial [Bacteroidales bacterium]|nr:T9SS type A sorting domain-containing protein [Bacteroidales bacterium]